jgi:peroxygenase
VRAAQRSSAPKAIVAPRTRVIRRFRNGDEERHLKEVATLPEQPVTEQYQPPYDLHKIIPNPGSPRAYNIPDRFHPEEDGADPRVKQTVLQQHVEFFDYDKDGVIWPWDTARGFRDIGYNPLISFLAPFFIHTGMSLPTQEGFPNLLLPIHIKNIHKCKHGSDSGVYDTEGRYVPQRFEELMSKYDKDNKGGLTYKELMDMTSEQSNLYDWFGRTASFLEWTVTYAGFKDENGVLTRDSIRKQYNGELFHEYAKKIGKSMKEKKGHGKHLQ